MEIFLAKSLNSKFTDEQIQQAAGGTRFLSFEAVIRLFHEVYKIKPPEDVLKGYKVTNQGIEISYE